MNSIDQTRHFYQVAGGRHVKLGLLLNACLCTSHVRPEKDPLEKIKSNQSEFFNQFNKRYERKEHVFTGNCLSEGKSS